MRQRNIDEFWLRVEKVQLTGCWIWTGYINRKSGYGYWSYSENGKTRTVSAHILAYRLVKGAVPKGKVLDHQCLVRHCCNPDHVKPVTQLVNLARSRAGEAGAEFQRSKTNCPQGHPYAGDNLCVRKDGGRSCRTCAREKARARRLGRPPKVRIRKTHCKRGHEFTADNTYIDGRGSRCCRECKRGQVSTYRSRADKTMVHRVDSCVRGHAFDEANSSIGTDGQRTCRTCRRDDARARRGQPSLKRLDELSPSTLKYRTHCTRGHEYTLETTIFGGVRRRCKTCQTERDQARAASIGAVAAHR